jgi:hypothetical protein
MILDDADFFALIQEVSDEHPYPPLELAANVLKWLPPGHERDGNKESARQSIQRMLAWLPQTAADARDGRVCAPRTDTPATGVSTRQSTPSIETVESQPSVLELLRSQPPGGADSESHQLSPCHAPTRKFKPVLASAPLLPARPMSGSSSARLSSVESIRLALSEGPVEAFFAVIGALLQIAADVLPSLAAVTWAHLPALLASMCNAFLCALLALSLMVKCAGEMLQDSESGNGVGGVCAVVTGYQLSESEQLLVLHWVAATVHSFTHLPELCVSVCVMPVQVPEGGTGGREGGREGASERERREGGREGGRREGVSASITVTTAAAAD